MESGGSLVGDQSRKRIRTLKSSWLVCYLVPPYRSNRVILLRLEMFGNVAPCQGGARGPLRQICGI